jgi:transposase
MRRRAYGAVRVNDVAVQPLLQNDPGLAVVVGIDVGKFDLLAVCRWSDGRFERPWRVRNPVEIRDLVRLIQQLRTGRPLLVALEPSGTYGDALRQALADAGLPVQRVNTKAAHDYAEVFDGVPSQHDGKDAAVVAELAALGKTSEWPYQPASDWEQELRYWVEWMVAQRQMLTMWQGRLEGLLSRYWPEATRTLRLTSVTLLRVLEQYGSPQALATDPQAVERLERWGGKYLDRQKVKRLIEGARTSSGVRPGAWEVRQIQDYARQALQARRQGQCGERQLRQLAHGQAVLQAQGKVVGVPTACVLWVSSGDPRNFHAAAAYRKTMGLNLAERSSGTYQGQLHLSKRGSARSRQWLYFAVLRLVQRCGVRRWYEAKKAHDPSAAKRVLVALMRKVALALYQVGVHGHQFDARRLFAPVISAQRCEGKTASKQEEKRRAGKRSSPEQLAEEVLVR